MTEVKISLALKGQRKFSADEADAIRRHFGYFLPHDETDPVAARIADLLSRLDEGQRPAVALYLEALTGDVDVREQA